MYTQEMDHVALRPFQQKILEGLYFLAKCLVHELVIGPGEVEDIMSCLKMHIPKFSREMQVDEQERVPKK